MTFKHGEAVIWNRRRKSRLRRLSPLRVKVIGTTPSGNVVVEYIRRYRPIRRTVSPINLVRDEQ